MRGQCKVERGWQVRRPDGGEQCRVGEGMAGEEAECKGAMHPSWVPASLSEGT